ncbi:hypothetical protein ScPMuIL_009777 [Solemya velum]
MDGDVDYVSTDSDTVSHDKLDGLRQMIRKNSKPLMEKRRRARINSCLLQLKTSVLQAMKKDNAQFSKLEKADILELTVKYLKNVQRQQMAAAMAGDPDVLVKYQEGYTECADEVVRYLNTVQGMNDEVKCRVMSHLSSCVHSLPSEARDLAKQHTIHPAFIAAQTAPKMVRGFNMAKPEFPVSVICNNYTRKPSLAGSNSGEQGIYPTAPVAIVLATPSPLQAIPLYSVSQGCVRVQQCLAMPSTPTTDPRDGGVTSGELRKIDYPKVQPLPRAAVIPHTGKVVWRPW